MRFLFPNKSLSFFSPGVIAVTLGLSLLSLASGASAQVTVQASNDTAPTGSGLANMNLSTLLNSVGITSNLTTDQISERAFSTIGLTPEIDVLFADNVRGAAAGYKAYHRIGWYQRNPGDGAPAESAVKDVVWESAAEVNGAVTGSAKTTTVASDFSSIKTSLPFELRLSSATTGNARGGPIYGNDFFNNANFRNIVYFKERNASGIVANSYIIGWEDLLGGGDSDYQDMVIRVKYVQAVNPVLIVPEGNTAALLGLALPMVGGLVVVRRRNVRK